MSNSSVKIVSDYRNPKQNEFFFKSDPFTTAGLKELLTYLEECSEYKITRIPHWQIENVVNGSVCHYSHGIRIEK